MSGRDSELLQSVLERATQRGATAADGFLVEERRFGATVRLGEVDTVTHSHDQRLSLRLPAGLGRGLDLRPLPGIAGAGGDEATHLARASPPKTRMPDFPSEQH